MTSSSSSANINANVGVLGTRDNNNNTQSPWRMKDNNQNKFSNRKQVLLYDITGKKSKKELGSMEKGRNN
eukprot:14521485-Ditylum_brightwellii.AAC.1